MATLVAGTRQARRRAPNWNSILIVLAYSGGVALVLAAWWLTAAAGKSALLGRGQSLPVLSIVLFAYLVSSVLTARLTRYPTAKLARAAVLTTLLVFTCVFALSALARIYYSRSFVLAAFAATTITQLVAGRVRGARKPHFLVVPLGLGYHLPSLSGARWTAINEVTEQPAQAIAVDFTGEIPADMARRIGQHSLRGVPVLSAAAVYEQLTGRTPLDHLSELSLQPLLMRRSYLAPKRLFDFIGALVLAVCLLPIMLVLLIAVRLDSSGPALFWQTRVGLGGRAYRIAKFRTMTAAPAGVSARFATEEGARITRLGRLLRRSRLDELPQLLNVLRGEMSLIGPRPEQLAFVEQFRREIPYYDFRHAVRPGITGWAQVNHGYAAAIDETKVKLEHDLYYARHLSPWLDLLVVYKTLQTVLTGFGAR